MKFLVVVLLVVVCLYGFYAGTLAAWSYFKMSDIVDAAHVEQGGHGAEAMRTDIVQRAREAGVPLDEQHVQVGEDERTLWVRLRWTWPVARYKGQRVLEIPLSLERSYAKP